MSSFYVLAIDIESTGPSLTENALVSIGCSLQDEQKRECATFSTNIAIPKGRCFDEECEKSFWDKHKDMKELILKETRSPQAAMHDFSKFIESLDYYYPELILVSDNPSFDCAWIDYYLSLYTDRKPLRYHSSNSTYRMLWDSTSIQKIWLCIKTKCSKPHKTPKQHLAALGLETAYTHKPLDDARIIAMRYIDTLKQIEHYTGCV